MATNQRKPSETDERFPSGPWQGFYLQRGVRGQMQLQLEFADGVVTGTGIDPVGEFVMTGRYSVEDGKVFLHKQYYGQHRVEYAGWAELQHGIWGLWEIHQDDRGGWQIWPLGRQVGNKIEAHEERPVEKRIPAGFGI